MSLKSINLGLACFLLVASKISAENWFSEYWQQIYWRMFESEHYGVRTHIRLESGNHLKNIRSLLLSEQFAYKFSRDVAFEIHYTYIHGHPIDSPIWRWQHRLELEANKIFFYSGGYQIVTRNRLEIRWIKNAKPQPNFRLRHRVLFFVPLDNVKPLKAFSIGNELFYNISKGYFDQDRICPCQLTFEVSKKVSMDAFLMLRLQYQKTVLIKSVVLGTQLNF